MILLRWAPFPEADVASYKVYRSIIGFEAPLVSLATLNGKTLQLKLNNGSLQTITFDGTTPVVDKINATLTGGQAYASLNIPTDWVLRSDIRVAPGKVEIVGGTSLVDFGLTPLVITEQSHVMFLANVPALVDPEAIVEFEDLDGALQDFYAISSVDSMSNESLLTSLRQPITATGPLCVLEGLVVDLQGVRIPDSPIKATLLKFPHSPATASHITKKEVTTLSGPDGRFSLALLQGALVYLEIPDVGFSKEITVPEKAFEFITDLQVDTDYRYPLGAL